MRILQARQSGGRQKRESDDMKIDFADIVLINSELKKQDTRYHVTYKDENTACINPPGECCLTDDRKAAAMDCIRDYYRKKGVEVHFSENELYFTCED